MRGQYRFTKETNVTEVGVSGYAGEVGERVEFMTPLVCKASEDLMMVMARRILELEKEVADLEGSLCNTPRM